MTPKQKSWLTIGVIVLVIIVGFAIYKGIAGSKQITTTTGGGSTTNTSTGIGKFFTDIYGQFSKKS